MSGFVRSKGSVSGLWMRQAHGSNPNDSGVLVWAVPDSTRASEFVLPLLQFHSTDVSFTKFALQYMGAPRICTAIQWTGQQAFAFNCHQIGILSAGLFPLLLGSS